MAKPIKRMWQRFRLRVRGNDRVRSVLAGGILAYLKLVFRTNRMVRGSIVPSEVVGAEPVILTLWHGRQFVAPLLAPPGVPMSAIVSRSADAELNAAILERLGFETIRGSGDRAGNASRARSKNGVGAFKALVRSLREGRTVTMIADRRAAPREAVEGLVRLARASGSPIVPLAYETSRTFVFRKAWDQAVVNLPFGRGAAIAGKPIYVTRDDDLEERRREVTLALNEATRRAVALCSGTADATADQPAPAGARARP